MRIYGVGGEDGYANWMNLDSITDAPPQIVGDMTNADLVLFTGGEDVTPAFYGEPAHDYTGSNIIRDTYERSEYRRALALGKPMIGICRGSQFLCVMNGGKLVQHQDNPRYVHDINLFDGTSVAITSTHHQAQFPWNLPSEKFVVLGWTENMLPFHENGMGQEMNPEKECEIVFYPDTKCLAIQGHPEAMGSAHPTIGVLRHMLSLFMRDKLMNAIEGCVVV
jgi:GMP synthase-like glutamine amidotransferase